MESPFLVFVVLPFLLGGAIMAGLLALTKVMPGEPQPAGKGAAPAIVPARGPEYARLTPNRKRAFRIGYLMLVWLAILTVAEIVAGLVLNSTALLLVVNILEAASILYVFMHIKTVWSSEEAH